MPSLSATANLSIGVQASQLIINTANLPFATIGIPYSAQLRASGGVPPYSWQIVSGHLPTGLTLDPDTGLISGVSTDYNAESFDVLVADFNPAQDTYIQLLGIGSNGQVDNQALTGVFAFSFNGDDHGHPYYAAGRFAANGNGTLSRGVIDINGSSGPTSSTFTGTYTIDGNRLGVLSLNTTLGTLNLSIAVIDNYHGTLMQTNSDPLARGSGSYAVQNSTNFSLSSIAGDYAFGATGADAAGKRFAAVGAFQLSTTGGLSNGERYSNDNGTVSSSESFTGTLTAPDTTTGRGTASLNINGVGASNYAYYIIDSQHLNFIGTDALSGATPLMLTATVGQPNGWNFTDGQFHGTEVFQLTGVNQAHSDIVAGLMTADGQGNLNVSFDENVNGVLTQGTASGSYDVSSNGKVTTSNLGSGSPILYLTGQNVYSGAVAAFVMGTDATVKTGTAETRTGGPFSNGSLIRTLVGGTFTRSASASTDLVEWLFGDGNGNLNIYQNYNGPSGPGTVQVNGTYQIQSSGRGEALQNGTQQGIMYLTNPNRCFVVPVSADGVVQVLEF